MMPSLPSHTALPSFYSNCLDVEYKNAYGTVVNVWFHWEDVNKIKQWMWIYDYDLKDIKKVVSLSLEVLSPDHKFTDKKSFIWFVETELAHYSMGTLKI